MTMLSPGPVERVDARPAEKHVVARAAEERVVTGTTDEDVVAVAAVLGEANRVGREPGRLDDVVAGEGTHAHPVVGRLRAGDAHPRGEPEHGRAGRVAGNDDHVVAARAVDDHIVRGTVPYTAVRGWAVARLGEVRPAEVVNRDRVGTPQCTYVDRLEGSQVTLRRICAGK
jgi:hypothetical protein